MKKERESKATEHAARHLKVHQSSGYKYKPTPEIVLKGDWLNAWGFESGAEVDVVCQGDGKLTITMV